VVVSRLDDELLRDVARRTGGRYFDLDEPGAADALIRTLRGLDRAEVEGAGGVRPRARHGWFILAALALLLVDGRLAANGARAGGTGRTFPAAGPATAEGAARAW
jgi:hypothetical protein